MFRCLWVSSENYTIVILTVELTDWFSKELTIKCLVIDTVTHSATKCDKWIVNYNFFREIEIKSPKVDQSKQVKNKLGSPCTIDQA